MKLAVKKIIISIIIALPMLGYAADKSATSSNADLKAVAVNESEADIMSVKFQNKVQWKILTHQINDNYPFEIECSFEYKYNSKDLKQASIPCHIDSMTVVVYAYEVNDHTVIFDFHSERGGASWLLSVKTNDEINLVTIPYMSGDEDGISFSVDEHQSIIATTREDKFLISPDESNEYYIRKYEGSGIGFKLYSN